MARRRGGNGSEEGWSAMIGWPDFDTRVLSASAVVAYVAVGTPAILGRSVTEAAHDALAWVLPRNGRAQREEEGGPRAGSCVRVFRSSHGLCCTPFATPRSAETLRRLFEVGARWESSPPEEIADIRRALLRMPPCTFIHRRDEAPCDGRLLFPSYPTGPWADADDAG